MGIFASRSHSGSHSPSHTRLRRGRHRRRSMELLFPSRLGKPFGFKVGTM